MVGHLPIPEMLGRKDTAHGQWTIDTCAPVRGAPMTNIVDKKMIVPTDPAETERHIRGHEMLHAKISPAEDFQKWIDRGVATEDALRVVEEFRVNFLLKKAGFDPEQYLADGSERHAGEQLSERGDWAGCVYTTIGFSSCASLKEFLTGVRRNNREWGATLLAVSKKVGKELEKSYKTGRLGSTEIDERTQLAPLGFAEVERIAEMIDRIANPPQPEPEEEQPEQAGEEGKAGEDAGEKKEEGKAGAPKKPPVDKDALKKMQPAKSHGRGSVPQWGELKVRKLPLTRHAKGGLGRKRKATDMGRSPRRIGNMLTDPQKRIFDSTKKGNGGVVIIDGSGSMSLKTEDIVRIVDTAHGATVAVYSADGANQKDNLLILAEKGKMVSSLPERNGGNGVDAPALRWAIDQKQHKNAPVIFITDGAVHGLRDGYNDLLAMDCINLVLKHKVTVANDVNHGVKVLEEIKAGRKPTKWYPRMWRNTYKELTGTELR